MVKGKKGKAPSKSGRVTRSQRRAMERSLSSVGLEDLDTQLRLLGLCTKNITGDGNCLFRALSDQYYGYDTHHKALRQEICEYLRTQEEKYKFFVEDDQSFEHHVEVMQQDATFGGNMELAAFAKMKAVDIKVYQPGMIYIINGKEDEQEQEQAEEDTEEEPKVLHIAYHSWEHYSSVRNIDGPYSGPPEIKVIKMLNNGQESPIPGEEEEELDDLNSKEKVVLNACPGTNIRKIRRLLLKYKGDPDKVIDALFEEEHKKTAEAEENVVIQYTDDKPKEEEYVVVRSPEPEIEDTTLAPWETLDKLSEEEETSPTPEPHTEMDDHPVPKEEPKSEGIEEIKIKKPSAAERKKEAKRKQKEAKLIKERAKAARKAKYKEESAATNASAKAAEEENAVSSQSSMKEMYI